MERMIIAQKNLEKALLILCESIDTEEKLLRVYNECLCNITPESLPKLLRMDYFKLVRMFNVTINSTGKMSFSGPDTSDGVNALLPPATILLYKRLTEWMAVESYIRGQSYIYS
ncbi:hypothetical protein V0H94_005068 [Salmonella enterica]|uniref:Uncharacterized protein n=2 Tax=Salmonella enterica TaxID=28901 RepID=A0A5Z4WVD1_SALER|nr:hypothetical protein [Salmonella enterica subsp. enterica serovar Pensacola]EAO0855812.1 hypothetical protein [Salmonella enterica]ECE0152234.1 hypothetical protein [Salmonella enterica subsp. enterica serovar Tallahassee]EDQ0314929.1 hypothetical protein [Salmonella enterica subsp. enterica serovar Berta]EDV7396589.1 hypothetical protein [Salmonella enterica subsp. enterica]EGZ4603090.1 hypothetical protein [Salmonella enterica subsp. enterica serovar Miami]ESF31452.1 hypothetical protein